MPLVQDALKPLDLGLILSYRCQCACAHCLYCCGPDWQDWMTPQAVREALQATQAWDHPFQLHITGGEPFLNFPLLLQATQMASELGIPSYVETNAGWCVREELIARRFTALRRAGLQAVLVSCSPFHAATIPLRRTERAIRIAQQVFGSRGVIVYLPDWLPVLRSLGVQGTIPLQDYEEAFGVQRTGSLFWQGYGLISGGRSGHALGHLAERRPAEAFQGENCRQEILYAHHSHFDLYGNYISWFCGGLTIGDWHELPRILSSFRAAHYPPLVDLLLNEGPCGLQRRAEEDFGFQADARGYAGKCHLCVEVRRHLVHHGEFSELRPAGFYDTLEREFPAS